MSNASQQPRIPLFFALGIGLSFLMAGLKAIIAGLAEAHLYSIPWLGGLLKSIELAELSNIVVFSLLSLGIGSATLVLPRQWNAWAKAGLLIAVSPFVFGASYMTHHYLWVERVATQANLPYRQARQLTNTFLKQETGSGGFWGFYAYSTEVADLPVRRSDLEAVNVASPGESLATELSTYNDPRADFVAMVFTKVGWLIRLIYMGIAVITALVYYFRGYDWAESRRQAAAKRPPGPSSQPRPKRSGPKPSGSKSSGSKPAASQSRDPNTHQSKAPNTHKEPKK